MLLGEFHCTADGSGKLKIPAEFSAELGRGLTLTRGIDRCLFIYPAEEWHKLVAKVQGRLPLTSRDARAFSGALACAPDKQGQIPLPDNLRQYAGIAGEVVVIGLYTHLEVWSPQRWQEVNDQTVAEAAAVAERLTHLEI
jgi:MraZ protein